MNLEMQHAPIIDRETVEMLREMDEIADDGNLLLELMNDFLFYSSDLAGEIITLLPGDDLAALATKAHSLKGASLNIGALALFYVCDRIELMARDQHLPDAPVQLSALKQAFSQTAAKLTALCERIEQGEDIDDLLG